MRFSPNDSGWTMSLTSWMGKISVTPITTNISHSLTAQIKAKVFLRISSILLYVIGISFRTASTVTYILIHMQLRRRMRNELKSRWWKAQRRRRNVVISFYFLFCELKFKCLQRFTMLMMMTHERSLIGTVREKRTDEENSGKRAGASCLRVHRAKNSKLDDEINSEQFSVYSQRP